jgi:Family of unknown function (DUF6166)
MLKIVLAIEKFTPGAVVRRDVSLWLPTEPASPNPSTPAGSSATTALPGSNGEAPALGLDPRGGSGPAQLALAILADHLDDHHAALNLYQHFKRACIAQIRGASWSLSGQEIDNWLAQLSENQEDIKFSTGGFTR